MRTQLSAAFFVTVLVCSVFGVSAQAQVNRTFVSAAGSDSNNCANVTTPCRHFAAAYAATAPHGEIFVLDPANYGSLTITQAVSIEGHGWASIAPPSNGNAITINAGPNDSISIHGVSIDGTGATGGTNGIVFNSGGSLTVTNCTAKNFVFSSGNTGNGVFLQPTSGTIKFAITNTVVANNDVAGILYFPPSGSPLASGVIEHLVATGNNTGIEIINRGSLDIAVSNSVASNNNNGIFVQGGNALTISIDNTTVNGNSLVGIEANIPASVLLSRSVIQGNGTGTQNSTGTTNTFYTYGNNLIDLNGNNFSGTALNSSVTLR
jgi:hypothetical protein